MDCRHFEEVFICKPTSKSAGDYNFVQWYVAKPYAIFRAMMNAGLINSYAEEYGAVDSEA